VAGVDVHKLIEERNEARAAHQRVCAERDRLAARIAELEPLALAEQKRTAAARGLDATMADHEELEGVRETCWIRNGAPWDDERSDFTIPEGWPKDRKTGEQIEPRTWIARERGLLIREVVPVGTTAPAPSTRNTFIGDLLAGTNPNPKKGK